MVCKRKGAGAPACTPCKQPCAPPPPGTRSEQGAPPLLPPGDCPEGPKPPGDCHREPPPDAPDINQLPPSILLKIISSLSLDARCLSASLVCKYWRDLGLDFQFWKQLDLSSRQQVTDELLEKIASRNQNIIEINISNCRSMSDIGNFEKKVVPISEIKLDKNSVHVSGEKRQTVKKCMNLPNIRAK
ncbi:hypothetical protein JEQ12_001142 [Ovis aries]|uniref:F-box domain-containing protein n=1 Tax=Ovis aries TaxID=9940 RepID=A0A836AQG0_SHEEP|nr:hypothetical protein JEQ12_001142 [Ovis aries]